MSINRLLPLCVLFSLYGSVWSRCCKDNTQRIIWYQCLLRCKSNYISSCPDSIVFQKCINELLYDKTAHILHNKSAPDLPAKPTNLKVEIHKSNKFWLEWKYPLHNLSFIGRGVIYQIEVRTYIGTRPALVNGIFNDWQWEHIHLISDDRDSINKIETLVASLRGRRGRWYQFRVAAINKNGYRYSEPSEPFSLNMMGNQSNKTEPTIPLPPTHLTILNPRILSNGLVSIRVAWCKPKSDLPIDKYKVSWALYLNNTDNMTNSLFLRQSSVVDPTRYMDIHNLEMNSSYFFQVQAISVIYGQKRLKSFNQSLYFDSTPPWKTSGQESKCLLRGNAIQDEPMADAPIQVDIGFKLSKRFGMVVQVFNARTPLDSILVICREEVNCSKGEYRAIKTRAKVVSFTGLSFNTKYVVCMSRKGFSAEEEDHNYCQRLMTTFKTPKCEDWSTKYPNLILDCNVST